MERSPMCRKSVYLSTLAGVAALTFAAGASANIAQSPLIIANAAKSNLLLVLDDSGSMDWEVGFPSHRDGILHWNTNARRLTDSSGELYTVFQNERFSYLFPNGTGTGNKVYATSGTNGNALPPRPEYAFARSSHYNPQYYNPDITYRPWLNIGDRTFANADPRSAISDPVVAASARIDLTSDLYVTSGNDWLFRTRTGMRRPDSNGRPGDTVATGDRLDAYTYYPATYYVPIRRSITLPTWLGSGNCNNPQASTYNTFHADWSVTRQGDLEGRGVDAIGPGGICLQKVEIKSANSFPSGRSYADEIQNFANWFVYHRKRHLALRAGLGEAFENLANVRAGSFTLNTRNDVTMWDLDDNRASLYNFFYGIVGRNASTPNRQALNHAGLQFDTNSNVITAACQHNFALQFTDGYSNQLSSAPNVGNADGTWGAPFADTHSNTLGDIAALFYNRRLRADDFAAGKVPVPAACNVSNPAGHLACRNDLHMRTFAITLGAQGHRFGVTHHTSRDAHNNPFTWSNPTTEADPVQIDDLYHAAVNGRGELLNARSTQELTERLRQALTLISDSVVSSASSAATNSTRIDAGTMVFQARFNSANWSGELLAYSLDRDGIGDLQWDAGDPAAGLIPLPTARRIYTRGSGNTQVEFQWHNLSAEQRDALDRNRSGQVDGLGQRRVDFLRGDRSREQLNGGPFRDRARVLGDIVNSSPEFVGRQDFGYSRLPAGADGASSYAAYVASKRDRAKMIYVGANDGMLHAFDADTGHERWAYVPSELVGPMRELTDPNYRHRYYVDGSPAVMDAYWGGEWRSVLVTTLGAGGRSVVALDVTSPDNPVLLWEYQHAALGHVMGRPSIARLQNGRWAAIFGSGYGLARSAKLFIVDLETGVLTTTAPISTVRSQDEATAVANGMSPPIAVDVDRDRVADYIYAGDLLGHLWKFDVSASNPNQWGSGFTGAGRPQPLFAACASGSDVQPFACPAASRQPITMRPEVGYGPDDGQRVYFGTGKYFEVGDNVVAPAGAVQSFYGIEDDNSSRVTGRSQLTRQTITAEVTVGSQEGRGTSRNPADANSRGWYLDLLSPSGYEGERAVSTPVLYEGLVIFATLIPSSDPCESGGTSWLMAISTDTGGAPLSPVFDLDGDGEHGGGDNVGDVPASGRRSNVGIIQTPRIVRGRQVRDDDDDDDDDEDDEEQLCPRDFYVAPGSTGGIEHGWLGRSGECPYGRTSWRQLWP
jgi:type IV pilus assembly protein PilY1